MEYINILLKLKIRKINNKYEYNYIGDCMRLSDLQSKDIVDIENGTKIGNIIDVIIDDNGNMKSLVVQKSKFNFFANQNIIEIAWRQVRKIGKDVILVNTI